MSETKEIIKEKVYFADNGYILQYDDGGILLYANEGDGTGGKAQKELGASIGECIIKEAQDWMYEDDELSRLPILGFEYTVTVRPILHE